MVTPGLEQEFANGAASHYAYFALKPYNKVVCKIQFAHERHEMGQKMNVYELGQPQ